MPKHTNDPRTTPGPDPHTVGAAAGCGDGAHVLTLANNLWQTVPLNDGTVLVDGSMLAPSWRALPAGARLWDTYPDSYVDRCGGAGLVDDDGAPRPCPGCDACGASEASRAVAQYHDRLDGYVSALDAHVDNWRSPLGHYLTWDEGCLWLHGPVCDEDTSDPARVQLASRVCRAVEASWHVRAARTAPRYVEGRIPSLTLTSLVNYVERVAGQWERGNGSGYGEADPARTVADHLDLYELNGWDVANEVRSRVSPKCAAVGACGHVVSVLERAGDVQHVRG
jgi:hypothetical protein